jgi:hypothetical protein
LLLLLLLCCELVLLLAHDAEKPAAWINCLKYVE